MVVVFGVIWFVGVGGFEDVLVILNEMVKICEGNNLIFLILIWDF